MRKLLALGASVVVLVAVSAAPAFAQSSSDQTAGNSGSSQASNGSTTAQSAGQSQSAAGLQQVSQNSDTVQTADSNAYANQSGVNANVTVTIGGHDVYGGNSSATQNLSNVASGSPDEFLVWLSALAANIGATLQTIFQFEDADCLEDCIDGVQIQLAVQDAATSQTATVGDPDLPTPSAAAPPQAAAAPEPAAWDEHPAEPPVLAAARPLHRDAGRAERGETPPRVERSGQGASPPPSANWGARRSMAAGGVPTAPVDRTTVGRPAAGPSDAATTANAPIETGALGLDELNEETAENATSAAIPALLAVLLLALGGAPLTVRTLNGARGL